MANLFDGIKKVSEEELREQIALLETFTMTNISKQTGQKVAKKLVQATNLVTGLMKKTPLQAPEVLSIDQLLEKSKLNWQMLGREELEIHLKNILKEKCNALRGGSIEAEDSDDALSVFIIDQVAEHYELKEELLPSQKADLITKCYAEEKKALQRELRKQVEKQQIEAEGEITDETEKVEAVLEEASVESMNEISIKEDIQESTIGEIQDAQVFELDDDMELEASNVIENTEKEECEEEEENKQVKQPLDAKTVLELQMPLGKNKLIRELFAQLIVLCVEAMGGQMECKEEILPSWLPNDERIKLDKAYQDLMQQHAKNEENYEAVVQKLLENDRYITSKNKLIEYEEGSQAETKERIKKLVEEKESLLNKFAEQEQILSSATEENILEHIQQVEMEEQRMTKEVRMKDAQISTYEGMLTMSKEEIKSARAYIDIFNRKHEEITKEVQEALKKKEATTEQIQNEKEERQKSLEEKWQTTYSDFKFEQECLKSIYKTFALYEIVDVERALMELHNVQDVKALSWGELDKKDYEAFKLTSDGRTLNHLVFSLSNDSVSIIIYETLEEEAHRINVIKIIKYSE